MPSGSASSVSNDQPGVCENGADGIGTIPGGVVEPRRVVERLLAVVVPGQRPLALRPPPAPPIRRPGSSRT